MSEQLTEEHLSNLCKFYSSPQVVIDIETVSLEANAGIFSIGAVEFCIDPATKGLADFGDNGITDFFTMDVNPLTMTDKFCIDTGTLNWINKNNKDDFVKAIQEGVTLDQALLALKAWLESKEIKNVWGNSPVFDNEKIRYACKAYNIDSKFINFRKDMDVRTLAGVMSAVGFPKEQPEKGLKVHNALGDCIWEAKVVRKFFHSFFPNPYQR